MSVILNEHLSHVASPPLATRLQDVQPPSATSWSAQLDLPPACVRDHGLMAKPIDPRTEIGHVHLKVADLDRALAFYTGVLGFEITQRMGDSAAFLSAGGYHHHIGLNTWESHRGTAARAGHDRALPLRHPLSRSRGARRCAAPARDARRPLDGASDHGVSEALYLRDPDGNGIELYWDRPRAEWPRDADGTLQMVTEPLDLTRFCGRGRGRDASGAAAVDPTRR